MGLSSKMSEVCPTTKGISLWNGTWGPRGSVHCNDPRQGLSQKTEVPFRKTGNDRGRLNKLPIEVLHKQALVIWVGVLKQNIRAESLQQSKHTLSFPDRETFAVNNYTLLMDITQCCLGISGTYIHPTFRKSAYRHEGLNWHLWYLDFK